MDLADRLHSALKSKKAEQKRMFGGTCFMLNGNMVTGTFKGGLIVRVGEAQNDAALILPGARPFEMNGRVSRGFIMVEQAAVASDAALRKWLDMALAFNATLPAKAKKALKRKAK
ncbi:MAG: TfoX/Sxy family protein [Aestuariivirga sp.]